MQDMRTLRKGLRDMDNYTDIDNTDIEKLLEALKKQKEEEKIEREKKANEFLDKYLDILHELDMAEQINLFMRVITIGLNHLSEKSGDSRYGRLYKKFKRLIEKTYYRR